MEKWRAKQKRQIKIFHMSIRPAWLGYEKDSTSVYIYFHFPLFYIPINVSNITPAHTGHITFYKDSLK